MSTPISTHTHISDKPIRSYTLEDAFAHIVVAVDIGRFRALLKETREGANDLRPEPREKLGRPALSKRTLQGGRLAVNSQTIKNIEDGVIKDPGIVTVARIIEGLGVPLSQFFGRLENKSETVLQMTAPVNLIGDTRTASSLVHDVGGGSYAQAGIQQSDIRRSTISALTVILAALQQSEFDAGAASAPPAVDQPAGKAFGKKHKRRTGNR